MTTILEVHIPEYKADEKPDPIAVGSPIDKQLIKHFSGQAVVLRCVGLQDHPGKTLDELVGIVLKDGTDRYDENRKGVGYHVMPKGTDTRNTIYGQAVNIDKDTAIMAEEMVYDFYLGALGDRGYSIRFDLVTVYDHSQLEPISGLYKGTDETDGFSFKDPNNKAAAVLGIIKVL